MAKLYFRHGTMGSAKTLNLLAVAHNYRSQNKHIILMKPKLETRFNEKMIISRAGIEKEADILLDSHTILDLEDFRKVHCILVDEAHFLSKEIIEQLRRITLEIDVPVICYGLRTDFQSYLFEGSKRLMELADTIEEIKSTCYFCSKKSIMNLRHVRGVPVKEGPTIQLGAEESYYPMCAQCYFSAIERGILSISSTK